MAVGRKVRGKIIGPPSAFFGDIDRAANDRIVTKFRHDGIRTAELGECLWVQRALF